MPAENAVMDIDLDMVQTMEKVTLHVTIKREREMKVRIWIAVQLIKLAALVTNMGIEWVDD
jgi:hypothetical protein